MKRILLYILVLTLFFMLGAAMGLSTCICK